MELEYGKKYDVKIGMAEAHGIYIGRIRSKRLKHYYSTNKDYSYKHTLLTNIDGVLECWTFYEFHVDNGFLEPYFPQKIFFKNKNEEEFAENLAKRYYLSKE